MVFGQFKNLIRHGKAAKDDSVSPVQGSTSANGQKMRQVPDSHFQALDTLEPTVGQSTVSPTPATAKGTMAAPITATAQQGGQQSASQQQPQNGAQAHLDEARSRVGGGAPSHSRRANSYQGDNVAQYNPQSEKIVQEERAASEKLPQYEGLSERFMLLKKMGDGAFSNVYMARDQKSGQKVAIKVVRKYELNSNQDRLDPQFRKKNRVTERANILKEVQIMRNLKHPGIVQLLEFSESRDHYFLVLELLEGGELFHQIVKLTYFSESLARHVILQVAHGIRYLHEERGVVHRDIKPENLLFESINIIPSKQNKARPYDEEKEDEGEFMPGIGGGGIGRVKIADFGLSKVVWEESTMTPCGTVGYTAPEIVKDERYSKSVDMWALGCVLYTLLCGFPPFYDESISVLTEKVAKGYYTFLSPWWDDISDLSKDLITHLLCVDSSKRYTIDEFLAHPWCNVRESLPALNSADIQLAKASEMPLDSPLLSSMKQRRAAMMSPGINQLKEAFDVTYAVHRMEEEGARKRGAAGQAPLNGLNEEEEDDDAEQVRLHHGDAAAQAVEQRRRQQEQEQRARQQAEQRNQKASQPPQQQQQQQQQQAAQHYQGRGGADRKLAEAALYDGRAGTRDRGSNRRKNFELNIGNATLLGRRNKGPLGEQPSIHAQMLDVNHPHQAVDGAGKAGVVPGSPMHIDQ